VFALIYKFNLFLGQAYRSAPTDIKSKSNNPKNQTIGNQSFTIQNATFIIKKNRKSKNHLKWQFLNCPYTHKIKIKKSALKKCQVELSNPLILLAIFGQTPKKCQLPKSAR